MILPAQQIRKLAFEKQMIAPFLERGVSAGKTYGLGPCTYDVRIKQRVTIYPWNLAYRYRFYKAIDWVRSRFGEPLRYEHLRLGFTLASTIETVAMPDDVAAHVMDKSSWARKGLSVYNTHFDPGFKGYPTLELANNGNKIIDIPEGIAICQFKFEWLTEATEMPYVGKYQNQPDQPVEAKVGVDVWA